VANKRKEQERDKRAKAKRERERERSINNRLTKELINFDIKKATNQLLPKDRS
jgi:hypothetical protein